MLINLPDMTIGLALWLILFSIFLGIITATIEMMFQYFMLENMILFPYGILLAKIASKGEIWRHLMRPLGRCRYCNGIWITIYTYLFFFEFSPIILIAMATNFISIWLYSNFVFQDVDAASVADHHIKVKYQYPTPWPAMLKSYIILGIAYSIIYGIIPIIAH